MFRRLFGILMILAALIGIGIGVGCAVVGPRVVDQVAVTVEDTLTLVSESLTPVEDALVLVKDSLGDVNEGMQSVGQSTVTLANVLTTTRPLLDEVATVTRVDVPTSIEAIQVAIPTIAEVGAAIDSTLTTLSAFNFEIPIPFGAPLSFDLGIDYSPPEAFDQTILAIGDSLTGLPERMRAVADEIDVANQNLERVGQDISLISQDLEDLEGQLAQVPGLLDQYILLIGDIKSSLQVGQSNILAQFQYVKIALIVAGAWFAITQLAPLYVGWGLLQGKSAFEDEEQEHES